MTDISYMDPSTLKPAAFYILLALVDGDAHGYAVMHAARDQAGGQAPIQTASFYRHLAKLIDAGLVAEVARPADVDPRRGAYYRLTPRGRQALVDERQRMAGLVAKLRALTPVSRKNAV